ncbi:MAG: hypothetical protein IJK89_02500 [Clostridia bacterium]|nr:hypothetical protein [Clostridia bacterium]
MNSRDLLCAVAGIDEGFVRESEQFSSVAAKIKAERKRERQKATAVALAAAICVAMFWTIKLAPPSFRLFAPSGVTNVNTLGQNSPFGTEKNAADPGGNTTMGQDTASATVGESTSAVKETEGAPSTTGDRKPSVPAGETTRREPGTEAPSATTAPEKPTTPEATAPSEPRAEPPTEPSTDQSEPGSTGAVYSSVNVSYTEAKEIFGHPIVSCSSSSFIGYQVGVVSRNGNIHESGAFCLSVTYRFLNGSINLQDQDRSAGSVAHNTGDRYEYGGRTFYVWPDYADDGLYIGYFPTGDDGIAYQAFFDEDIDVYTIMDLISSVEI